MSKIELLVNFVSAENLSAVRFRVMSKTDFTYYAAELVQQNFVTLIYWELGRGYLGPPIMMHKIASANIIRPRQASQLELMLSVDSTVDCSASDCSMVSVDLKILHGRSEHNQLIVSVSWPKIDSAEKTEYERQYILSIFHAQHYSG